MKELVGINRRFSYYFNLLKDFRFGKDIRLYNATGLLMERVNRYINEDWVMLDRRTVVSNRFAVAQSFLSTLQQGVLYAYLGLRVLARAITVGEFQMLISAAGTFMGSMAQVLYHVIDLGKNAGFMYEYVRFMQYPAAKVSSGDPVRKAPALTFELCGVSFKYHGSDAYALRDLSLRIPAGQKLAVVGPNGAGKTTLVKLLTRLYNPSEGEILLDWQDTNRFAREDYANLHAVVFQDYKLLAFSIRDNVALGKDGNDAAVRSVLRLAGLEEKVAGLARGIDTPVYKVFDDDGLELSGGESQKLAIARAIYRDAPVVTLDEPTAALDPVAEYEVYRRFDKLVGGKTAIYISHRLSSCRFCDRIAVLDGGRLVEYGTHEELLRRGGRYLKMWDAQAQWYAEQRGDVQQRA